MFASLVAAGALLAVPATGQAKPAGQGQSCTNPHKVGLTVGGTLVSVTADDPTTPVSEATVTLKITSANRHLRKSGEIADQDASKKGVQVKGAEFTVAAGDAFLMKLNGYEGTDTPSVGDKVMVKGKIALTKKRCATAGTSTADRYGAIDVRKVTISDRDPDA
jgi:hypothetical protein